MNLNLCGISLCGNGLCGVELASQRSVSLGFPSVWLSDIVVFFSRMCRAPDWKCPVAWRPEERSQSKARFVIIFQLLKLAFSSAGCRLVPEGLSNALNCSVLDGVFRGSLRSWFFPFHGISSTSPLALVDFSLLV